MKSVIDKCCREKSKHTIYIQYLFCSKIVSFRDEVEGCRRAGQAIDNNIKHVYCKVDT